MKIKAVGHYVLIEPDKAEETSAGGIVISLDTTREQAATTQGVIVDVGPNAWKAFDDGEPWAQVGNHVVFAKYAAKEIVDPETEKVYFLMSDENIIAKIGE